MTDTYSAPRGPQTREHPLRIAATAVLDTVLERIARGERGAALDALFAALDEIRDGLDELEWQNFAKDVVPRHPLAELIHADPLTRRAFAKPRGYAGDAVLLDYIYGILDASDEGPLSQLVHEYCSRRHAIRAVRARRHVVAHAIDRCTSAAHNGGARVLSVACGHLREAQISRAVVGNRVAELVALDSDEESLEVAESMSPCVTTRHMSVRRLLTGQVDLGSFDFVYSSGLYDYLDDRVAQRLTRSLFGMLRPGGRLMLCNFLPTTPDIGFIESFMDWDLIYRKREEIEAFAAEIEPAEVVQSTYSEDAFASIGYLELRKRASTPG